MTNKDLNIKWYSLDKILKYDVQYYMIFGERSNGKSYAVDKYMLDNYYLRGEEFALVKRYEEDIKGKYMENLIDQSLQEYVFDTYGYHIKFYRGKWLTYEDGQEGKISECKILGHAFSLANVNRTKATSYPNVTTVLFEEFMSITSDDYLNDELNLFLNLISTIVRYRHNLKIFMLANAISKYSPYSSALGIKLHRIKKGEIITREYKDKDGYVTKFAIERSENVNVFDNKQNTQKVVYNNFGNAGVGKMITSGDFETHSYKRKVGNVTFAEFKSSKKDIIVTKKNLLPIAIQFEDYYYKIYIMEDGKFVLAFREMENEQFNPRGIKYLINGTQHIDGIINIANIAIYDDEKINRYLSLIVTCMRLKDFITLSDDDGENVVNAFRMAGLSLTN